MRKHSLIRDLIILAGFLSILGGCGSGPAEPIVSDLDSTVLEEFDFSGFEEFIRSTDLPEGTMVTVAYAEIDGVPVVIRIETPATTVTRNGSMVLPQMENAEANATGEKDGDDGTEVQVTWGELKALYR